jgi:hypothetical protein
VYFDVQQSFEPYGQLSGNTLERLKEGEGGRVNADNQARRSTPRTSSCGRKTRAT